MRIAMTIFLALLWGLSGCVSNGSIEPADAGTDPDAGTNADDDPGPQNNPFWCTYGPAPNLGTLIRQDGIIEVSQEWIDIPTMESAIDNLLK